MAYADLGGLGSKQGAPVVYDWVAPSPIPQLLPWLAILALLILKPNRCGSAWWIWVPLAIVGGLTCIPESVLEFLPSSEVGVFLDLISALGFGLAAVWLLSGYLEWKHRMLAFLGIFLSLAAFSVMAYALRQDWGSLGPEAFQVGIFLAVSVLVISVAISLAGLMCRGRSGWLRLIAWLLAALVVLWALIIVPVFILAAISSGGRVPMLVMLPVILVATGITLGVLVPFLVLAFANGFYRERLKGLLRLGDLPAPPVITATAPVLAEATGGVMRDA